jgi:multidrug efflux pump subunit AcrA (membrane-fusion protein)
MNSRVLAVVLTLAAIIVVGLWWIVSHRSAPATPSEASPSVALATARYGDIPVTVNAVGRLGPSAGAQSRLAFAVPGRIASIDVHVGQRVAAGEVLARLDTTGLSLAQQQANADAVAADANARAAAIDRTSTRISVDERALERAQRLYAAGVAARKDIDAARAQLAADRADAQGATANRAAAAAQAQSAGARAASAAFDTSNGTLRAPVDAIVAAVLRSPGESVDPTVAVITLSPQSSTAATLDVTGADAARISPGDVVTLHVGAGSERIAGRVVGVAGAVDPVTQSAQVSVAAGVPQTLAGTAVSAEILVAHDRGILIPRDAVVADPQSGQTLVFAETKKTDGSTAFAQRKVTVVYQNADTAEVTGLAPGERIAAHGAFELLAPVSTGD